MITIEVKGIKNTIAGFKRFKQELATPRKPLNASGFYMKQEAIKNFPAKGSIMQRGGWPPLAKPEWRTSPKGKRYWFPGTQAIKKSKRYGGQPIMVRTGKLRKSFIRSIARISPRQSSIEVRNPVHYAIEHQRGYGKLPRRVLLKFRANHIKKIRDIFADWVVSSIKKSFQ